MIEPVSLVIGLLAGATAVVIAWLWTRQGTVGRLARLQAERDAAVRAVDEQRELLNRTQAEVRETFAALSRDALKDNRTDFLHTADALLAPVRDTLGRVQAHLTDVDKAREGSFQSVTAQLRSLSAAQEQLRTATEGLSRSLRSPNVRGKWGEIQLRRILELAGMLHHCDFVEKESVANAEGARRTPDLVVRLPGGTTIVIDSRCRSTLTCRPPKPPPMHAARNTSRPMPDRSATTCGRWAPRSTGSSSRRRRSSW
jgi:DNA recombination protein RmuC